MFPAYHTQRDADLLIAGPLLCVFISTSGQMCASLVGLGSLVFYMSSMYYFIHLCAFKDLEALQWPIAV